jgi:predicted ATPase
LSFILFHCTSFFKKDLQWADSTSLRLLHHLGTRAFRKENGFHLLFIGAYRDNEIYPGHLLQTILSKFFAEGIQINDIKIEPLTTEHLAQLIMDTFHLEEEEEDASSCKALASLVHAKTGGLPFFVNQFLKSLYAQELISYNHTLNKWEWELNRIASDTQFTENVLGK